jgi:hypothetical protein
VSRERAGRGCLCLPEASRLSRILRSVATEPGSNLLTWGYRSVSSLHDHGLVHHEGVHCDHVNTLHNALQSPAWECLLSRIGTNNHNSFLD